MLDFKQYVFWPFRLPSILSEYLVLDLCHFILTAVKKTEKWSYSFRRLGILSTSDINLYYDAISAPLFYVGKKQHERFAKLLPLCATKDR